MTQLSHSFVGRRINLLFIAVLLLGTALSAAVYVKSNEIRSTTLSMVETDIEKYAQFHQFRTQLEQQERFLYEHYAAWDSSRYYQDFLISYQQSQRILQLFTAQFGEIAPLIIIRHKQRQIADLAEKFAAQMEAENKDSSTWDDAREQLTQVSVLNLDISEQIQLMIAMTEQNIVDSQQKINRNLLDVRVYVFVYGLIFLFIFYVLGKAIKAYMSSSRLNQRLSLFTKKTPNAIVSLDRNNQVTYSNPATGKLLSKLGLNCDEEQQLLAQDLHVYQSDIRRARQHFARFEYEVNDLTLDCELHWLADQQQWDLHLTDITDKRKAEQQLVFQAFHHPDTGLPNQYQFSKDTTQRCALEQPFTLGLIEIRSFNQLLANNSHQQVEQLISQVSKLLHHTIESTVFDTTLYHIGDKRYSVLIESIECGTNIAAMVRHINRSLSRHKELKQHAIELDFGFACYPQHATDFDELITRARFALDASAREALPLKLYDQQMGQIAQRQTRLLTALRQSIKQRNFELYFQPQFAINEQKLTGAEVLLRWNMGNEAVSPEEFIPLAERSGLILPIGDWVLNHACDKARQLVDKGFTDLVIAVNISPRQFNQPDFVEQVANALKISGLPANNLELEITEGVIMHHESDSIDSMHQLKKMGVKFAIDDFGTGYSSLSYLKNFPLDMLKIDKSFISQITTDNADQAIVRTIVDLGHNLNLKLIAEGVEHQNQLTILSEMGCHAIQGYLYAKPMSEADFFAFAKQQLAN